MGLDYIIFHASDDTNRAVSIHENFQSGGFSGFIYDIKEPINVAIEKACNVMVCLSNNIVDETFLPIKNFIVKQYLEKKTFRLSTIYLENRISLTDEAYRFAYGLLSIIGFYPKSKYFESDVRASFAATRKKFESLNQA